MSWYEDNRHGSARWASQAEITRAGLYGSKGVFLGLCPYTGHPQTLDSDMPITLIGGAGSGKGTTMLSYNNFYHGPMLRLDPKGEHSAMTAHYQKRLGKDYWCLNPSGMHRGSPWNLPQHKVNPFDILRGDDPDLVSHCMRFSAMINPQESGNPFFIKRPRQWCTDLLHGYALAFKKPTLKGFAALVSSIEGDFGKFSAVMNRFKDLGVREITSTCIQIEDKKKSAPEEYSGVMSTLSTNMQFMADPRLKELFSGADFSLECLTKAQPSAVVDIAFPAENLGIWSKALRLIIGTAILYQQRSPGGVKPLFQIDEAAQLGHFEELEQSFTYGRSFYRTLAGFQDIGQISRNYGQQGPQTFLGSSQTRIFIGIRDIETARLVSSMLGDQTISVRNPIYEARARHSRHAAFQALMQGQMDPVQAGLEMAHWDQQTCHRDKEQRPLLTADEVLNLPEDLAIVFIAGKNMPPILAKRVPYYQNPALPRGAFLSNPYHV